VGVRYSDRQAVDQPILDRIHEAGFRLPFLNLQLVGKDNRVFAILFRIDLLATRISFPSVQQLQRGSRVVNAREDCWFEKDRQAVALSRAPLPLYCPSYDM